MKGCQISFYATRSQARGQPLCEWLIVLAKELGLRGAAMITAAEGFGQSGKMHSVRFFDLADQPQEALMMATESQAQTVFARIRAAEEEGAALFYVKSLVEFGAVGDEDY